MYEEMERAKSEEGFTLIELLVVVLIIGILATIALPAFLSQRERGWQTEAAAALHNVGLEVETAGIANANVYPATIVYTSNDKLGLINGSPNKATNKKFLISKNNLYKDNTVQMYYYREPTKATTYRLCATHSSIVDKNGKPTGHMIYDPRKGGGAPWVAGGCDAETPAVTWVQIVQDS